MVTDTDESVMDFNEIWKVESKNDNVQSFNTRWDATTIGTKKQPDEVILVNLYHRQLQQLGQLKPLLCLYIQDTFQKGESRDYTDIKQIVVQYLEHNIREKRFFSDERQLEKPVSGAAAAKSKSKGKGKRNIANNGQQKVNALEEISVE